MKVSVKELSCSIQGTKIIQGINLEIKSGEFIGLVGPNGSGKSTLLKNLYRTLQPDSGQVHVDCKNLYQMSHKETAKNLAVVSQETSAVFDFTVTEIVHMGRHPHKKMFAPDTAEDTRIVESALDKVGLLALAKRSFMSLSGGEKQRVLIARALAQQANIIILDEPTNHLDIHYQLQIMEIVKQLGITVLAAIHDLNIASIYCDSLCIIHDGKVAVTGTPEEVLTPSIINQYFDVFADVTLHPVIGKPVITYIPGMLVSLNSVS